MPLFGSPEEHAANPPQSWRVIKAGNGRWRLVAGPFDLALYSADTRKECLDRQERGFYVDLWHQETRWYAGEEIPGWKPYRRRRA